MKRKRNVFELLLYFLLFWTLTACASPSSNGEPEHSKEASLLSASWDQVVTEAKGQTVNWYMWGGSDAINEFIDRSYAPVLKEKYGITLKRVPLGDTAEAVTKVLNEKQAGKKEGGSVDLVWINGENFASLKQADALFGPFATKLPNARYVDYSSPAVSKDFGFDTEGYESVWGSAQFQFVYDSNRIKPEDLPHNYRELKDWATTHPGRFTYDAPPDFTGTRFVKQLFYERTGGHEQWFKPFDRQAFDSAAAKVWDYLNEIKPSLWRKGEAYPKSPAELSALFNNGEVDFAFTQNTGGIRADIGKGQLPETARPYVFDSGTIGDYHYVAIPYNAAHKAAAMVVANLILEPRLQFDKADSVKGWGDGIGIDPAKLRGDDKELYEKLKAENGETAVPADELSKRKLPDLRAEYTPALEEGWKEHVLFQK